MLVDSIRPRAHAILTAHLSLPQCLLLEEVSHVFCLNSFSSESGLLRGLTGTLANRIHFCGSCSVSSFDRKARCVVEPSSFFVSLRSSFFHSVISKADIFSKPCCLSTFLQILTIAPSLAMSTS